MLSEIRGIWPGDVWYQKVPTTDKLRTSCIVQNPHYSLSFKGYTISRESVLNINRVLPARLPMNGLKKKDSVHLILHPKQGNKYEGEVMDM